MSAHIRSIKPNLTNTAMQHAPAPIAIARKDMSGPHVLTAKEVAAELRYSRRMSIT